MPPEISEELNKKLVEACKNLGSSSRLQRIIMQSALKLVASLKEITPVYDLMLEASEDDLTEEEKIRVKRNLSDQALMDVMRFLRELGQIIEEPNIHKPLFPMQEAISELVQTEQTPELFIAKASYRAKDTVPISYKKMCCSYAYKHYINCGLKANEAFRKVQTQANKPHTRIELNTPRTLQTWGKNVDKNPKISDMRDRFHENLQKKFPDGVTINDMDKTLGDYFNRLKS